MICSLETIQSMTFFSTGIGSSLHTNFVVIVELFFTLFIVISIYRYRKGKRHHTPLEVIYHEP